MSVAVTGATGHLGRLVVEALLARDVIMLGTMLSVPVLVGISVLVG